MKNKKNVLIGFLTLLSVGLLGGLLLVVFLRPRTAESRDEQTEEVLNSSTAAFLSRELLARVNFSADPCDDFHAFACGHWHLDHPLPADRSSWNAEMLVSEEVGEDILDALRSVDLSAASNGLKITKNFFNKCVDTNETEKQRAVWLGRLLTSGQPEDAQLPGFANGEGKWPLIDATYADPTVSIEAQIGRLKSEFGIDTFVFTYALQSDSNSSQSIAMITGQMLPLGLGLAPIYLDYYLDPDFDYVIKAYSKLQATVARLLAKDSGFGHVEPKAEDLAGMLAVEVAIARLINRTADDYDEELRTVEQLKAAIPEFNWDEYFGAVFSDQLRSFVSSTPALSVMEPDFIRGLAQLFKETPRRDVQNYVIWRLVLYSLPFLSSDYRAALADFRNVLAGRPLTPATQEATCLAFIRGNYELPNLGFGAAEALIRTKFNETDHKRATAVAAALRDALGAKINRTDWMDEQTKAEANKKVGLLEALVGYPDFVADIKGMNEYYKDLIAPSNVSFGSLNLAVRGWAARKNFELIGNTTDRLYFLGSPVLTNAWYQQSRNSIVVPLGELHSPAFGGDYPNNVLFGALGGLVGHEISHGFFDPNGAQFDGEGNLRDWWSDDSKKKFKDRQSCLIDQYSSFCYNDDKQECVNGKRTLSENAADLAGLQLAYLAYEQAGQKETLAAAPMFSSDQLFFLSFPIYWCGEQTDAALQRQLTTDGHSPPRFRVNGALRNVPEFAAAFGCPAGSWMNPTERCTF
ncbi:Phosphate-regulating neutral endopeptidase [Aphelenchoides fujianensis]|nr:Phosphate-regulating neutral endopeptidase [Aphelenchoides fujianensis]